MRVQLDAVVPLGEPAVPHVWVFHQDPEGLASTVRTHPAVEEVEVREIHEDRGLLAIDWETATDPIIQAISEAGAQLLTATGTDSGWRFELRFPDRAALSSFKESCGGRDLVFEVGRISNPSDPDPGPVYGLSQPQREAMELAQAEGYFEIPRRISTKELGEKLGISDQAVTERLRRGISRLLERTLMRVSDDE